MEKIDIKIENTSESYSEESSDISREQEKWTPKLENFIDDLAGECKESFLSNQKARSILEFRSHILNGVFCPYRLSQLVQMKYLHLNKKAYL